MNTFINIPVFWQERTVPSEDAFLTILYGFYTPVFEFSIYLGWAAKKGRFKYKND